MIHDDNMLDRVLYSKGIRTQDTEGLHLFLPISLNSKILDPWTVVRKGTIKTVALSLYQDTLTEYYSGHSTKKTFNSSYL